MFSVNLLWGDVQSFVNSGILNILLFHRLRFHVFQFLFFKCIFNCHNVNMTLCVTRKGCLHTLYEYMHAFVCICI